MDRAEVQELVKIIQFQTQLSVGDIAAEIGCSRDHFVRVKSKSGLKSLADGMKQKFEKEIADFRAHFSGPGKKTRQSVQDNSNVRIYEPVLMQEATELGYIRKTVFDAQQSLSGLDSTLKTILRSLSELEKISYLAAKKNPRQTDVKGKVIKIKKLNKSKTEPESETRKHNQL